MADTEQQAMTSERLRQALDESMLTHTSRSIGDLASQRVIDDLWPLIEAREAALLAVVRAVASSNPYGSWYPADAGPAGVVCRWCMERAYTPAQCQHDQECTWRQARALLASAEPAQTVDGE